MVILSQVRKNKSRNETQRNDGSQSPLRKQRKSGVPQSSDCDLAGTPAQGDIAIFKK